MSGGRDHLYGLLLAVLCCSGCAATSYDSACHELTETGKRELNSMLKRAKRARFERHVVLLETGTGMASNCQSYYIDGDDYRELPASMTQQCEDQGYGGGYCMVYWVDGERKEQLVNGE